MDLSRFSRCLIRNKEIPDTPEERVRQALLQKMVGGLGFPRGLVSVERGLDGRRTDIVSYTRQMCPLLLVECKAEKLTEAAFQQALGYNEKIKAPFICIASADGMLTFWFEKKGRTCVPFLPTYAELCEASKRM